MVSKTNPSLLKEIYWKRMAWRKSAFCQFLILRTRATWQLAHLRTVAQKVGLINLFVIAKARFGATTPAILKLNSA
jgi:hypothetical protein